MKMITNRIDYNVKGIAVSRVLYVLLFGVVLFSSCGKYSSEVEMALELAGENRQELESVLNHYRALDKKKYKAACFLY